jgi:hypothetical protein
MNPILKWSGVVALVVAIIACFLPVAGGKSLAGITDTSYFDFFNATTAGGFQINGTTVLSNSGIKLNSTSDTISRINSGQCYIQPYATTIAASTTAKVDCQATAAVGSISTANDAALNGVSTGDYVQVTLATSTAGTTSNGLVISGANASTTAGYIQLNISNLTGTTFTWPTSGTASGTAMYLATPGTAH